MINTTLYEEIIERFLQNDNILLKAPINMNNLLECYKRNNKQLAEMIDATTDLFLKPRGIFQKGNFHIMSWNVRYWTTVDNEPSINQIYNVIDKLNPDIICLQEMTLGNNEYYSKKEILFTETYTKLTAKYKVISICSATPSWYADIYGNAILIEKTLNDRLLSLNSTYIFGDKLCDYNKNKCFYNQQSHTYYHIPPTEDITKNAEKLRYQNITNENKCYIKLSFPIFDLICVHLDAYSINTRIKQLDVINSEITRPTIIMGDFNFFNYEDLLTLKSSANGSDFINYTIGFHQQRKNDVTRNEEYRYILDKLKWSDIIPSNHLYYSQWTLTRVDHVFLAKFDQKQHLNPYVWFYPSNATDHLPLIFQIDMGQYIKKSASNNIYQNKAFSNNLQVLPMSRMRNKAAKQMNKVDHDIQLYNGQPIQACDWILSDGTFNSKYGINDPFLTGNSDMVLGNNGLYATTSLLAAASFATSIKQNMLIFTPEERNWGLDLVSLCFTFKCEENDELNIVDKSTLSYSIQIADRSYDIIYFTNTLLGEIWKFTPRKYNENTRMYPHLLPQKMIILVGRPRFDAMGTKIVLYDKNYPLLTIKPSNYKATTDKDEKLLNEFVTRTRSNVDDEDHQLAINWDNIAIVLKNAVDWINAHNASGHLINFDWNKIHVYDTTEEFEGMSYDVIYQHPQQVGGSCYFHKYLKYKYKYLATKL